MGAAVYQEEGAGDKWCVRFPSRTQARERGILSAYGVKKSSSSESPDPLSYFHPSSTVQCTTIQWVPAFAGIVFAGLSLFRPLAVGDAAISLAALGDWPGRNGTFWVGEKRSGHLSQKRADGEIRPEFGFKAKGTRQWQRTRSAFGTTRTPRLPPASTPRPFPTARWAPSTARPATIPSGKEGDVLTVEFTVAGIPCHRPQRRARVQAQRSLLVPDRHRRSGGDRPLLERHRRQWRPGERVRLVQGQVGRLLADHAARADRGDGGRRRRSKARVRCDDGHEEDRRRRDRGGAARLTP